MKGFLQYFENFSSRERLLILLTLTIIVLTLSWAWVVQPRYQQLQYLREQVPIQQQEVNRMRKAIAKAAPLLSAKGKKQDKSQPAVLQIVEQTADKRGMRRFISRMKPDKDQSVKVWLEGVAFDDWLLWLEILQKKGIEVSAAKVTRTRQRNVNIRMTLAR